MSTAVAIDRKPLVAAVRQLPSLPAVVAQVLAVMRDPQFSLDELVATLSLDQALSARVLQLANSPFYGVSGRVNSIRDGISILGLRQLGTLVLAAVLTRSFERLHGKALKLDVFWRHAIACAVGSRALARSLGLDEAAAFTAGLLHDVGRLVLDSCYPVEMQRTIEWAAQEDVSHCQAERQMLGVDHSEIGGWVCEHWRFPSDVVEAIRLHHHPVPRSQPGLVDVVHVGDALAHALDLAGAPDEAVPRLDAGAWERIAPRSDLPLSLLAGIEQEFESLQTALQSA